jgi:hypothetical protein
MDGLQRFSVDDRTAEPTTVKWVIYGNPIDYPGKFVLRPWRIRKGQSPEPVNMHWVADTLAEVRAMVPEGLACVQRNPLDDVAIVETWI